MDIKHLINLLPYYYKEFDSYKVDGKGLLERFLELIGTTLSNTKDKIDTFLNVISIDNTNKENLDLLAKQLGNIPFTGSNSIDSLKITEKQRRILISISTWLIKNRGSKDFFRTLFDKLHNSHNKLSLEIIENVQYNNLPKVSILDYDARFDKSDLDIDCTLRDVPTVIYKVTGNIPKSIYGSICDILTNYSPFNVIPLVYINGEFQSRLNTPYQLRIEYFDTVSKLWKSSPSTFSVGQNTNYFRVVAYNTNTGKEVMGVKFTTKYSSDKSNFTGINTDNILVTPYYYEIDSLPYDISSWSRTFVPKPTIPSSGEEVGTEVTVKYIKTDTVLQYTDNIVAMSLFDDMSNTGTNTYSITKGRYDTAVVGIKATRVYSNGTTKNLGVVNSNTGEVVWPTTVWYDRSARKIFYSKPATGVYKELANVSIFNIFKESTHVFYQALSKGTQITIDVKNNKSTQSLKHGKILVREHGKPQPWSDNLDLNVQVGPNNESFIIPPIDILVLNPNLPNISFDDNTVLTPSDVINLLQGSGIVYDSNSINNKPILPSIENQEAFIDWQESMGQGSMWRFAGTNITGMSWQNQSSEPVTLPYLDKFTIMSKNYSNITSFARVNCKVVRRTALLFYDYIPTTRFITRQDGNVVLFSKIKVQENNDPNFNLRDVDIVVTAPNGIKTTVSLVSNNPNIIKTNEGTITYSNWDILNMISINTGLIGKWVISVEDSDGIKSVTFDVQFSTNPKPNIPDPSYIRVFPAKHSDTEKNTSWSPGDNYSSITQYNSDDALMFQIELLDNNKSVLDHKYTIYLTDPSGKIEEGTNEQSYIFNKPGRYIFSIGNIKHTLEINSSTPKPSVKATPSSITFDNSDGRLDVLLNRVRDGLYTGDDARQDTIIMNVNLETDQEWTATLEDR